MHQPTQTIPSLSEQIKKIPPLPGVYFFKDAQGHILYIGKAKNLKNRTASYVQNQFHDAKVHAIFEHATTIDYHITNSELEAMLMEAQLIQSNQPQFNVIFKSGQPFVYLLFTSGAIPELQLVRNRNKKGTYIGPFLEKNAARTVYNFLIKTFSLKLCKKKIENGCLDYHLGICAGICRKDFDLNAYKNRLTLAHKAITQGHKEFLETLMADIHQASKDEQFEQARELHEYYQACQKAFLYLDIKPRGAGARIGHDIWLIDYSNQAVHLFIEQQNVVSKKQSFYYLFTDPATYTDHIYDYITSYYRTVRPALRILITHPFKTPTTQLLENFLQQWHKLENPVTIITPTSGHEAALIRYATVSLEHYQRRQATLGQSLKKLLALPIIPTTIDCFDISHKQGHAMVGACVRFTNGHPDKPFFRHFHIKTVHENNDYASLAEVIKRRYKQAHDIPDLILIDGGKGQLSSVMPHIPPQVAVASLAKREETLFSRHFPEGKKLDIQSFAGQTLIALRDYTHHFAISFHRATERKKQVLS